MNRARRRMRDGRWRANACTRVTVNDAFRMDTPTDTSDVNANRRVYLAHDAVRIHVSE